MKNNKGITLIALIVTIIVLIILAGVAIAMLSGQNGVINRASQARYDTAISSFDEQVRLAQMSLRTEITANMVGSNGYIATKNNLETGETGSAPNYFTALVNSVKSDLGVTDSSNKDEDFFVYSFLDEGKKDTDGTGYILITYSNNALRSSLPKEAESQTTFTSNAVTLTRAGKTPYSVNQAVLAYVIKVSNYNCELSKPLLTDSTTIKADTEGKTTATQYVATTTGTAVGLPLNTTSTPAGGSGTGTGTGT